MTNKKKKLIELKIFQQSYVDALYRDAVTTNNYDNYLLGKFPFEEKFPKGSTGIFIPDNLELVFPDGRNKKDLENTILIYESLKSLNETQASDERLWAYLTHVTFWKYMRERWPLEKAVEEEESGRFKDRYFLRNINIESLSRNGIARLWWYAHLTYDSQRSNPYELTEILLSRADLSTGITERAFGSNRNIRIALLEFLKENPAIASHEKSTRKLYKGLNLAGGVRNLPYLEISELKKVLEQVKESVAD